MKNHFHLLVKIKPENQILHLLPSENPGRAEDFVSRKFSNLFNGYTQGFNKMFERTGSLFDTPSRRIEINKDEYFSRLIFYIHFNPQRHNLCTNYKDWMYSSYQTFLSSQPTQLKRKDGLEWFGGLRQFVDFHDLMVNDIKQQELFIIEYE